MPNLNEKILNIDNIELDKYYAELNSICSYLAMFPSKVPKEYIEKYTEKGDLVFEPFSGRGTTTLEAIRLGRRVISNDLSPLAYVLTKSKTYFVDLNKAIIFVKQLEKKYNDSNWEIDYYNEKYNDIRVFYSKRNLTQLDFLRKELGKKWNEKSFSYVENYVLAIALGIAHGQTRKSGDENNSLYFSVNMPNGYSMAPDYAKKYIEKNNFHRIENNIFDQIIYRIKKKRCDFLPEDDKNKVYYDDALKSSKFFDFEKPKLIFTSPPYLNLVKYVEQNWIRFWLLGFDKKDTRGKIVNDYHALEEYKDFLIKFMLEMEKIMTKDTKLVMVIGDVKNILIKDVMEEIVKNKTNLEYAEEPLKQKLENKLSRQMGSKHGRATENDWVFNLRRRI